MLKALMPVLVYSIGVALSKDIFKCNTMSNMAIISVGVAIAAYGEANFNVLGVVFQLSALIFEATRLVLIQASRLVRDGSDHAALLEQGACVDVELTVSRPASMGVNVGKSTETTELALEHG